MIFCGIYDETHPHFLDNLLSALPPRGNCNEGNHGPFARWQFDLICARIIQPRGHEKIGNVTVHRVGFGTPFDKYLPILGVKKATEIAKEEEVGAIWLLLASYGGFAALAYTWSGRRRR